MVIISKWLLFDFSAFQLFVWFLYFHEISFPLTGRYLFSQVNMVLLLFLTLQIISARCPMIRWENVRQGEPNCDTKWEIWCYHKSRCFSCYILSLKSLNHLMFFINWNGEKGEFTRSANVYQLHYSILTSFNTENNRGKYLW